jgi:hypothetical protein
MHTMPTWYDDSFLILHYDHQYSPSQDPLSGFDPEQARRLLAQVRPDAVQYPAKGHAGCVPYPTRFGNQVSSVPYDAERDLLATYRDITREMGIRFVIAYSGLIDRQAASWSPGWLRVRADHSAYPNRALCPNAGYVEELMLPQLEEILERFTPDGIWIDAEAWTVSPCYCNVCASDFQMLQERSAPIDRQDPLWDAWLQFHRESFDRHVTRVGRFLHERSPELVYAGNGSYCTHQPEPAPDGPDRLTWDLSPAFSLRQAGMEARFLDGRGIPFDLMTWSRCSARPWPQGRLPALPVYPKTFEHLAQEGAAILASGGRWSIWMTPQPDGALPEGEHGAVHQAAAFARERQDCFRATQSAAYAAILHSDATHRRSGNGLYDPGPSLDRIRGAHQALLELHHPHDILNEEELLRSLDQYWVIILPEQTALPLDVDEPLAEWVRRGGRLIASGRVSPRINEDIPTFALEDALGVQWTGQQDAGGYFLHRGTPLQVAAPVYRVGLAGALPAVPSVTSSSEIYHQDAGFPAVTRHSFGEGEGYYIAADFFAYYHRSQYPGLRDLLGDLLEQALPQPMLLTTAPPTIEIVLRKRGSDAVVHFVNHAAGKSLAQNSAFIEKVPPSPPFSVTLLVESEPASVRLLPGGKEPEWSYSEGALTVFIPPVHLHSALELTAAEDGG